MKARVWSCRIVDPSAIAEGADGVPSLAARRQVIHQLVSDFSQTIGAREVSGVLWLTKPEFVRHQQGMGVSAEEAAAKSATKKAEESLEAAEKRCEGLRKELSEATVSVSESTCS